MADDRAAVDEPTYKVHDVIGCLYEKYVGHPITGKDVPPLGTVAGWAHPDNCPDCAANPALGRAVHVAEQSVRAAIEAIRPFFEEDIPEIILLKIVMSSHVTIQQTLKSLSEALGVGEAMADDNLEEMG